MAENLTLFELNRQIKDTLAEALPGTVWVVAEISELKENRAGHCYLELVEKDDASDEIIARARATIWSYTYRMLKPYFETTTGRSFSDGLKILISTTVEFHEAYGMSLNVKDINPIYTIGDLSLKRKEILDRLHNEGVFDMNRELPLPLVPQNIAVISSATAAGYQDFVEQLEANPYGFKFYHKLFEAFMQGNEAVPSIIAALERIFEYEDFFDAVVIIRGGGAQADLSCFDDYDLAYFITQFPLPVITGIGHEKDETIVDLVAHTKMKTPTAVAEFLVAGLLRFSEHILGLQNSISQYAKDILTHEKLFIEKIASGVNVAGKLFLASKNRQLINSLYEIKSAIEGYTSQKTRQLDEIESSIRFASRSFITECGQKLSSGIQDLKYGARHQVQKGNHLLENIGFKLKNDVQNLVLKRGNKLTFWEKQIQLLDPEKTLKRGYTLTLKDGEIIKSKKSLKKGDLVETRFSDGKVESKIEKL